jgi:hypothetical protein
MSMGATHFPSRLRGRPGDAGKGQTPIIPLRLDVLDTSPVYARERH